MSSALQTFLRKYANKKTLVGLTAWDYPSGLLAERSGGIDLVHVSDSLGKVILGLQGPISLTLDVSFCCEGSFGFGGGVLIFFSFSVTGNDTPYESCRKSCQNPIIDCGLADGML